MDKISTVRSFQKTLISPMVTGHGGLVIKEVFPFCSHIFKVIRHLDTTSPYELCSEVILVGAPLVSSRLSRSP
jgi:hypothetical protein